MINNYQIPQYMYIYALNINYFRSTLWSNVCLARITLVSSTLPPRTYPPFVSRSDPKRHTIKIQPKVDTGPIGYIDGAGKPKKCHWKRLPLYQMIFNISGSFLWPKNCQCSRIVNLTVSLQSIGPVPCWPYIRSVKNLSRARAFSAPYPAAARDQLLTLLISPHFRSGSFRKREGAQKIILTFVAVLSFLIKVRGLPNMTSAMGVPWGSGVPKKQTKGTRLCEFGGLKKS